MIQWYARNRGVYPSVSIRLSKSREKKQLIITFANRHGEAFAGKRMQIGYDEANKRLYFRLSEQDGWAVSKAGANYQIRLYAFEGAGQFVGYHELLFDKETGLNYVEVGA